MKAPPLVAEAELEAGPNPNASSYFTYLEFVLYLQKAFESTLCKRHIYFQFAKSKYKKEKNREMYPNPRLILVLCFK